MEIIEQLERLRSELKESVNKNKEINAEVIKKSMELDQIINQYYQNLNGTKP